MPTYRQLAHHFRDVKGPRSMKSAVEAFRKLKARHDKGEKTLWPVYVSAYKYETRA